MTLKSRCISLFIVFALLIAYNVTLLFGVLAQFDVNFYIKTASLLINIPILTFTLIRG